MIEDVMKTFEAKDQHVVQMEGNMEAWLERESTAGRVSKTESELVKRAFLAGYTEALCVYVY